MKLGTDINLIAGHGKKPNQKLKPYVVLQYLLKYTDENNVASALTIIEYLKECGIYAERRSIYRDIEDINKYDNDVLRYLTSDVGSSYIRINTNTFELDNKTKEIFVMKKEK